MALILIVALVARLPGLLAKPLWYDEAFAVLFASKGPWAMVSGTLALEAGVAADVHPLLYYTVLWGWGNLLGNSPVVVRSLSVLMGLLIVLVGYLLACQLFGIRTGEASGWLLALSPFQVHYAQEVRMYALLGLLLLSATWVYWKALQGGSFWMWVSFSSVLGAAAQYTHNLAVLFLVPLALTPVWLRNWRAVRNTVLSGAGAMILYLPWLVKLPSQLAKVRQAYWIEVPGAVELVRTLLTFTSGLPVWRLALPVAVFSAVLLAVTGAYATLVSVREGSEGVTRAAWIAYLAAVPVLLMFVISQRQPIYLDRAMLPSGALFLIWLAWAFTGSPLARYRLLLRTGLFALAVALALGLASYYTYRGFPYAPFAELDQFLVENRREDEVILHSNKITAIPSVYYEPDLTHEYLRDPPQSGSDTLARPTQQVLGLYASNNLKDAIGEAQGVWFVFFPAEVEQYRAEGFPEHPALSGLQKSFRLVDEHTFRELKVLHFVR